MRWQALSALSFIVLLPLSASAEDDFDGVYLSLGPSVGAHFHDEEGEALVGGEATLFQLKEAVWKGLIADGRLIAGEKLSGLVSLGLEAGYGPYGVNAAPVIVFVPSGPLAAGQASFSLSFLFVHAYLRVGYGPSYGAFGETAFQFKLPAGLAK